MPAEATPRIATQVDTRACPVHSWERRGHRGVITTAFYLRWVAADHGVPPTCGAVADRPDRARNALRGESHARATGKAGRRFGRSTTGPDQRGAHLSALPSEGRCAIEAGATEEGRQWCKGYGSGARRRSVGSRHRPIAERDRDAGALHELRNDVARFVTWLGTSPGTADRRASSHRLRPNGHVPH